MPIRLAKPKRKPQHELLSEYGEQIRRAQTWRETQGYDELWRDLVDVYRGRGLFPSLREVSGEDRIMVNQAFSTINVIYPAVSLAFPKINVAATRPELEDRAVFVQAMVNYQWDHFGFHEPFREAVKDSLIIGHGWAKTLWTFEETDSELTEEEFAERFAVAWRDEQAQSAADDREPRDDVELATEISAASTVTVTDRPVVERISPHDMYVNPEATSTRDMSWIAQRVIRHAEEARNDPAYAKKVRERLEGGLTLAGQKRARHDEDMGNSDYVEVWEFYDLRRNTMCVFAGEGDDYLIRPRKMPYSFGHPFELVENYKVPDHFYPIGDLEMIVPLVKELSKTRSEMMNHRAKNARKYMARKSAIARGDLKKIASKRDGEVIMIEDDSVPLSDVIQPIPQIGMDAGLYNWSEQITDDIQDVSGVSEFARGGTSAVRRTATEASLMQDAQNARSAEKLDRVEGFISSLAKRLVQINQQFMTGKQAARIIGREGASLWVPYTREDIKGAYDFKIEAGSTQPRNESFRRQSALTMMQAMTPFIELGVINVTELLRHVLRDGFDVRNPEKFMQQQPQAPGPEQGGAGVPGVPGADPTAGQTAPQLNPTEQQDADVAAALEPAGLGV